MPRAKRSSKAGGPAETKIADQQPLPQAELAEVVEETSKNKKPTIRVFAHDNPTGLRYIEDTQRRLVALHFAERPDDATLAKLRVSPFQWNNDDQAWVAHANYMNRHAGQKLFREIAGIQLEGPTPL